MKTIKIIALLFIGYSLIGCGASKVASSQSASNGGLDTGAKAYADCGSFQSTTLASAGVVSTFVSGTSYIQDLIRLKLTQLNSTVYTSDQDYIQIYRWTDSNGTRSYNTTAAPIVVQLKSSGEYLNNGAPWDRISKANIDNMIAGKNLGAQGITAANFAANVIFILQGMDIQYQAMTLAFYNSTVTGTAAYNSIDVLLPSFDANPNSYAAARPANSLLPALHPNWAARSSGMTNQQYKSATAAYCLQF